MITITCKLKFKDQATVTAKVSAATPYDEGLVIYTGDTARLTARPHSLPPMVLKVVLKNIAKETGADLSVLTEGEFEMAE